MLLSSSSLLVVIMISSLLVHIISTTTAPTKRPTALPTYAPTVFPTRLPTPRPTAQPTLAPVIDTSTIQPSKDPTPRPTARPTAAPTNPTANPTYKPTYVPTPQPTARPTTSPTAIPTARPTALPTFSPSQSRRPTLQPSADPTASPTFAPSSYAPTELYPTSTPSSVPSKKPTPKPSPQPTNIPVANPTLKPTVAPSVFVAGPPTSQPSSLPSAQPVMNPSSHPSSQPTFDPSSPSSQPSTQPSCSPTLKPTPSPSTADPTFVPTVYTASVSPTPRPTATPTTPYNTQRPSGVYERFGSTGTVTFIPDTEEVCNDLEIQISFSMVQTYNTKYPLLIAAPGITSGPCTLNQPGQNLTEILIKQSNQFSVDFQEGFYDNLFHDSVLLVTLVDPINLPISANTAYSIFIDRSVGLRRVCYHNATWKVQTKTPDGRIAYTGKLSLTETYVKKGFMFHTRLSFVSPTPQYFAGINISIYAAFTIDQTTRFDIALPGFTSYWQTNYPLGSSYVNGSDYSYRTGPDQVFLDYTTNSGTNWTIRWWEGGKKGTNLAHNLFNNQTFIRLSLPKGNLGLQEYWVYIPRTSHVLPRCGVPTNYEGFTYQVTSKKFFINTTRFDQSDSIGPGCKYKSDCNGHGRCDYCSQSCQCYDGYGSASDLAKAVSNDFQPDCSARACPIGRSHGSVSDTYGSAGAMHPLIECSNNGVCDRDLGECKCFDGFGGSACEKMDCPKGHNGKVCSGRGICTSIKALTYKKNALPLMASTGTYTYGFRRDTYSATNTWDADMGRMCLCDSSWTVGFGTGETQTAEYFGPACEFRHCPSGDDPMTSIVDETDCQGKTASTGSADVGSAGNLCQVDCSNRGLCDHSSGECTCLPGFFGINCGLRQRHPGVISRPLNQNVLKFTQDRQNNPFYRDVPQRVFWDGVGVENFLPQY